MRKSLPKRLRELAAERATFGADAELFAAAADRVETLELMVDAARVKAEEWKRTAAEEKTRAMHAEARAALAEKDRSFGAPKS